MSVTALPAQPPGEVRATACGNKVMLQIPGQPVRVLDAAAYRTLLFDLLACDASSRVANADRSSATVLPFRTPRSA